MPTSLKSADKVAAENGGQDIRGSKGVRVIDNAQTSPLARLLARETARLHAEIKDTSADVLKHVAQQTANEEAALSDAQIDAIYSRMAAL